MRVWRRDQTIRKSALGESDENLYIAVECREPLTDRLPTAHDGDVVNYQKEDLVELRFTAPGHGTHVHQLMVTATGAKLHGWFSKEAGGSGLLECEDWQARVSVVPGLWCVEMAVPFTAITTPSPAADERWWINVIRYRYVEGHEVSCWHCMYGSPHRPRGRHAVPRLTPIPRRGAAGL